MNGTSATASRSSGAPSQKSLRAAIADAQRGHESDINISIMTQGPACNSVATHGAGRRWESGCPGFPSHLTAPIELGAADIWYKCCEWH
jgi:hypothetical protein